jgi:hypothetical protein
MAAATLSLCFNNPKVFEGVVKIRRGETALIFLNVADISSVYYYFDHYVEVIESKLDPVCDVLVVWNVFVFLLLPLLLLLFPLSYIHAQLCVCAHVRVCVCVCVCVCMSCFLLITLLHYNPPERSERGAHAADLLPCPTDHR